MSLPPAQGIVEGEGVVVSQGIVPTIKVSIDPTPPATVDSSEVAEGIVLGES